MRTSLLLLAFGLVLLVTTSGCISFGYQKYEPGQINTYDPMVREYVDPYGDNQWFWVRGKVTGDVDGDGQDEQVVLATTHDLPRGIVPPPAINRIILLICRPIENGPVELLRRLEVFNRETAWTAPDATMPKGLHLPRPSGVARHLSARIAVMDDTEKGIILLSVWGDDENDTGRHPAWHAAYAFDPDGPPRRVFHSLALQRDPVIDATDLQKDGQNELLLEQVVCEPSNNPETRITQPIWVSVFARTKEGTYEQTTRNTSQAYDEHLLPWYEAYVRGVQENRPPARQALYAYYLGLCHQRLGQPQRAVPFLNEAARTGEGGLKKLAQEAIQSAAAP